jgi:hypothetical protein
MKGTSTNLDRPNLRPDIPIRTLECDLGGFVPDLRHLSVLFGTPMMWHMVVEHVGVKQPDHTNLRT